MLAYLMYDKIRGKISKEISEELAIKEVNPMQFLEEYLIPLRLKFGLLAFKSIAGAIFPWSNYLCSMLFWCDGKRTIKEINWLLSNQYGTNNLERLISIFKFMEDNGYIKLIYNFISKHTPKGYIWGRENT